MSEQDQLWASCLEEPDENTVRGVFADRLQEAGFESFAILMRGPIGGEWVHIASADLDTTTTVLQLMRMSQAERLVELESIAMDALQDIFDSDDNATAASAETNATMWDVDQVEVDEVVFNERGCLARVTFHASGEQENDRMYYGDEIEGAAEVIVDPWGRVSRTVTNAEVVHDDDGPFESDPDDEL